MFLCGGGGKVVVRVQPVSIRSAIFFVICSLIMCGVAVSGRHAG